jgi:hypothetical protein
MTWSTEETSAYQKVIDAQLAKTKEVDPESEEEEEEVEEEITPQTIPTWSWRNGVLNAASRLLDEEHFTDHIDWFDEDGYPAGHMVFNGGIYYYDNIKHDENMKDVYDDEFADVWYHQMPNCVGFDDTDMYIYMRQELEEEYGAFDTDRLRQKYNIVAMTFNKVLDSYQRDLQEANRDFNNNWIAFQALWRGHYSRYGLVESDEAD